MKLAFYYSLACTAKCSHCITFAGPKVRRTMPLQKALKVVDAVARIAELDGVVFTGGENLIHREQLLELVERCTAHGLSSEIITNAFWGTRRDAALATIEPFAVAGLTRCRVSIDRYHLPYVKPSAVHVALDAMAEVGFDRLVTCVVDRPNAVYKAYGLAFHLDQRGLVPGESPVESFERLAATLQESWPPDLVELLAEYGFALDDCFLVDDAIELRRRGFGDFAEQAARERILVQYQFLATEGRGRELLAETPAKHVDELPDTICDSVGLTPTVNPEGDFFPCCSSWVNFKHHRVGSVDDADLETLLAEMRIHPFARFMHHQGPAVLVRYLREQGHALPDMYTHPCHLCGTLLEHFSPEELVGHIDDFYRKYPWRMIMTSRGFHPAISGESPLP
jgi:hypothetical protein